jgi:malate dehydrogenase
MSKKKIALIGGGQIGQILALLAAQRELGDVVLLDIPQFEGPVKGKALDLMEMRPLEGVNVNIVGTSNYEDIDGADVVIITAGVPRKPGMSRDDLLEINLKIISDVANNVKKYAPNAFVIVVSNPLDAIVYAFYKVSGFAKNKVIGMAGALDSSRFKAFIAMETGYAPQDVSCMVLGGHGDEMVPLTRLATVGGVPVTELLDPETLEAIEKRTRLAGGEIVKLLGNGSAFFSPAKSAMSMAESYLRDQKRIIPSAALCEGEYGIANLFIGVPCVIGSSGIEKIIEIKLNEEEQAALKVTADHVAEVVRETGM